MQLLDDNCEVDLHDGTTLSEDAFIARLTGKHGLVSVFTDQVTRRVIESSPSLRVIANVAVGYNNIDLDAARERGVTVTNTPDVLTETTANLTWALILDCTRRVSEGDRLIRRGRWTGWTFDFMLGADLAGKQLGIVGMGRIGQAVARRATTFNMDVAYFSPRTRIAGKAGKDTRCNFMALDRLLATSDVVTLHCPLTPETRHLINQTALARMKRSAYLINVARGAVVDEEALVWALKNRMISGAALDVYEHEPEVHQDLLALENVVLAPHLGSSTKEARVAMADLAARNVIAVLSGRPPLTPVA